MILDYYILALNSLFKFVTKSELEEYSYWRNDIYILYYDSIMIVSIILNSRDF